MQKEIKQKMIKIKLSHLKDIAPEIVLSIDWIRIISQEQNYGFIPSL